MVKHFFSFENGGRGINKVYYKPCENSKLREYSELRFFFPLRFFFLKGGGGGGGGEGRQANKLLNSRSNF